MSTNKFPLRHPRRPQFSAEALELFRTLEATPPRRRRTQEFRDGAHQLARLLNLTTEFWGGCNVVDPGRFRPAPHYAAHQYWATVMRARQELLAALAETDEKAREAQPADKPAHPVP